MKRLEKNGPQARCPFCPGDIAIAEVRDPDTRRLVSGLVHSLPTCSHFDKLEADDFIQLAEQAGAGPS